MSQMKKYKVRVTLVAKAVVEIEVEAEEGYDPADLTPQEQRAALQEAPAFADWEIDKAVEVTG